MPYITRLTLKHPKPEGLAKTSNPQNMRNDAEGRVKTPKSLPKTKIQRASGLGITDFRTFHLKLKTRKASASGFLRFGGF